MTEPTVTLLDAARIVARGGDLDAKLSALTDQARSLTGASSVTIHLLDESGRWLVPAAGGAQTSDPGIDMETAPPAIAAALKDRRAQVFRNESDELGSLAFLAQDAASVAIVPLVTAGDEGDTVVDGMLVAALASEPDEGVPDALTAIADLVAVAIRQTRLENALNERADWLDRVANTDPLTGLANRRTFERMLELELARAGRAGVAVGLALIGVDGLARVRDRSGEAEADGVLRRVAATLAEQLRLVDTVARIGPDTFAAVCPGSLGQEAAIRVRDAVARLEPAPADPTAEPPGPTSVSVGIARFPQDGADAAALMAAAEGALDDARAQGPGSVVAPAEGP